MGLIIGAGTAAMALFLIARLVPRMVGMALWLGTTGFTAALAAFVLYALYGVS